MGYSPWSCKESDMTEVSEHSTLTHTQNRQVENSLQSSVLRSRVKNAEQTLKHRHSRRFAQSLLLKEIKYSFQNK